MIILMSNQDFSEETIQARWEYANGRCEKCGKRLDENKRGFEYGGNGWTAHHYIARSKGGTGSFENCRILCNPCHGDTSSFARHN